MPTPTPPTDLQSAFDGSRVLVTGGVGFIGSNLGRALAELGADVTLVDSLIPEYGGNLRNVEDLKGRVRVNFADVRDPFTMRHLVQGIDFLFNLAGQTSHLDSMRDPFTDLDINCRAQLSILEACRHHAPKCRLVFASTRQIYGVPQRLPVDEEHPIRPVDINGIHKVAGEWYHLLYSDVYGLRSSAARLTNTYGPGMRVKDARQTFLGIWVRRVVQNAGFEVWGDGEQLRDFNYVTDVVDALLRLATDDGAIGRTFNLGANERINLKDLAALLVDVAGSGSFEVIPFPADRKAIDIGDYYGDYSLIRDTVGWEPTTSLREGLAATVDYYRSHGEHYFASAGDEG